MTKSGNLPARGLILIVEDNKTTQSILLQMAASIEIDAEIAGDGLDALEKLAKKKYDIIVMDNEMPKLNGYETTKRIRGADGLNKKTPIISITANLTNDLHRKYLEAGMSDFLTKPFNILDLQRSIGHWLHSDQQENRGDQKSLDHEAAITVQTKPNLERLEKLAGRNPEGFRRFVETFLRDTSSGLNSLSKALAENKPEEAYRYAHSCSGASSFCGFTHLTDLLKKLETAVEKRDLDAANETYAEVCREFSRVENQLAMIY